MDCDGQDRQTRLTYRLSKRLQEGTALATPELSIRSLAFYMCIKGSLPTPLPCRGRQIRAGDLEQRPLVPGSLLCVYRFPRYAQSGRRLSCRTLRRPNYFSSTEGRKQQMSSLRQAAHALWSTALSSHFEVNTGLPVFAGFRGFSEKAVNIELSAPLAVFLAYIASKNGAAPYSVALAATAAGALGRRSYLRYRHLRML